jgi:hypothetical protein
MMNAHPFQESDSVEKRFVAELQEIRKAMPDSAKHLASQMDGSASAITDFMRQLRRHPYDERKQFYIESRLRDQKKWYSDKANMNARSGERWFWLTAGFQIIAVMIAIITIAIGSLRFNFIPALMAFAAVVAAWSQMKRYDELAKAYALAAQELIELEAIAENLNQESSFPQFVEQVEGAISREHTMWCARRDILLSR